MRTNVLTLCLVLAACVAAPALADHHKPSAPVPDGYKLVYSNFFDEADALFGIQATDKSAWRLAEGKKGKSIEHFKRANYKTKVRSPFNIALLDGYEFGDFVLECDMLQTGKEYGHRDMCIFFGFVDRSHFYYTHIATKTDDRAHNVFIVNDKPRTKISHKTTKGVDWGKDKWQHVRIERDTKAGTIRVFFNDMKKPIMEAKDTTFKRGMIGFGSFDDTGRIDNVRIWAPQAHKVEKKGVFKEGQPK